VYKQVIGQQNFQMGAVVSVILLVPAIFAFFVDRMVRRRQVALLSSRAVPYEPKPQRLFDLSMLAYCVVTGLAILSIVAISQFAAVVKFFPYNLTLTWAHYDFDTKGGGGWASYYNSIRLAFLTGVLPRIARHRDQVKDTILWEIDRGERLTAAEIAWAETKRTELYHRMRRFMERYDFFVLPVSQVPPFSVEQPYVTEIDGVAMETYIDWMKSCYYISIVGTPAISVPCGFTPEGLPVGLQIVGRHRDDWGLLQIAHAFERAAAVPSPRRSD